MLAGAGLTLSISASNLMISCCCAKWARGRWKATALRYAVHVGIWLVITTLYRYEKSLHHINGDLWGWSCGHTANEIQSDFPQLGFSGLCRVQVDQMILMG